MAASFRKTLPVALALEGRNVLLLGGGAEAEDKFAQLRAAGARVTLVAERTGEALRGAAQRGELIWFARRFLTSDLVGAQFVLLTDQDERLALQLKQLKARHAFWLCALDQPQHSDVFMVSIVRRGPLHIAIGTGGGAPLLARRIRQALEAGLPQGLANFARSFADLRASLRHVPKAGRTQRLQQELEGFAMDVHVSYPERND
ncbi:MAG TPA: bifunctional precorrin-2 dehydrogenase/sirohydrochlorin ferrochelatase [Polyangiales bacterium]